MTINQLLPISSGSLILLTTSPSPTLQILKPTTLGLYSASSAWPLSLDTDIHGSLGAKLINAIVTPSGESLLLATNHEETQTYKVTRLAVMDNVVQMTN